MQLLSPPKNRFLRFFFLMVQRYLRHNVAIQRAALAFYLLFTLFPFLIFISALLGLLQLDVAAILQALEEFLPRLGAVLILWQGGMESGNAAADLLCGNIDGVL